MEKPHLLVIDDEVAYSELTQEYLQMNGFKVTLKHDALSGLEAFKNQHFHLCILDVKMPLKDGFAVAEEIREMNEEVPIIFLTGQALKEDRIKGLKIGADDYLTKPFSLEELYLRIKVILKRVMVLEKPKDNPQYKFGTTVFNTQQRELVVADKTIKLTSIEAKLLTLLFENENAVLTRDEAMKGIWGDDESFRAYSLNVYISKIRKFLKEDPSLEILNLHGEGYKLISKMTASV